MTIFNPGMLLPGTNHFLIYIPDGDSTIDIIIDGDSVIERNIKPKSNKTALKYSLRSGLLIRLENKREQLMP